MATKLSHDKFMKIVGAKINSAQKDITKAGNRNQFGFAFSADRIRKSAENLYFQFSDTVNDPVGSIYKAFSEQPGIGNVGKVAGVDVVDINIVATQQSVLGYLSAERGMDKPIDTLWFQGLKALQQKDGDFQANEWVNHPYTPMSKKIRSAVKGSVVEAEVTTGVAIDLDAATTEGKVLTDTITVVKKGELKDGAEDVSKRKTVGRMIDGNLFFNDGKSTGTVVGNKVTITTTESDYKVIAGVDKTSEHDGAHTLKLKPAVETIQIVAQPRRIQLEQSFEENALTVLLMKSA